MSEWVNVKDRVPDALVKVLGVNTFGDMAVCYREKLWLDKRERWIGFAPTHWMPLPEPPFEHIQPQAD